MNAEIYYSKLSKEELISLLKDQEEAHLRKVEELSKSNQELSVNNQELSESNQKLIHENERLASEKKDLEEQVKCWKAKYEYELAKEKKGNLERFVTKSDNAFRTVEERRVYSRKKIPPTNDPDAPKRKKAQRIYSTEKLRELAKGNEIYTNDILPELMAQHPDWHFEKIGEDETFVLERVKAHIVVHLVRKPEIGGVYAFCGKSRTTVKILEFHGTYAWLHTKKVLKGKLNWPDGKDVASLDLGSLKLLIDSIDIINRVELKGDKILHTY